MKFLEEKGIRKVKKQRILLESGTSEENLKIATSLIRIRNFKHRKSTN